MKVPIEKPGSPAEILEHHGIKGMRWGHRKSGGTESSTKPTRQQKKVAKLDAKLEKNLANKRYTNELKAQLHNSTIQISNRDANRINHKPEYVKAYNSGRLKDPHDPISQKYVKEISNAYLKNINEQLSGLTNASGTKGVKAQFDKNEWLGFSLNLTDVKHEDSSIMKVEFVRNDKGWIVGFKIADDSMSQAENFVINFLAHEENK